jgi:hypothetical protein
MMSNDELPFNSTTAILVSRNGSIPITLIAAQNKREKHYYRAKNNNA